MGKLSFLLFSANTPWTYGLAEALSEYHHTHAVQFYDWGTYNLLHPSWSKRIPPPLLKRTMQIMPTGYAGQLEKLFRFYLQQLIRHWCQQLTKLSGEHPWVIVTEPYIASWVRKVPSDHLIYYNFDDYVPYRPYREQQILQQEKELIERAAITLCASQSQLKTFQKRHPHRASHIYHYPHGVISTYINCQPEKPPEAMTVGYVGNLGDRLDWQLIYQVITACPQITFVFVGGLEDQNMLDHKDWQATRQAVLTSPNVRHIGYVPSDKVADYYCSFAVNWIPYLVEHRFNKACCPTKIMDGIASGRPIISTDIPECRLYPEWISIVHSAEDAIVLIHKQLGCSEKPEADEKSLKQLKFAHQNTWQVRSHTLKKWLLKF
ncbi:glycosyltransferase [Nostoc sp. UHCC 0302]|uniref:glycosyltransferase n=1 Tax=Nostoc sp. UHCC 0302 TaxID=3134896 RepID=UPI00311C9439